MPLFGNLSDAIRRQPGSHKIKREYVFSDHHSDILGTGGYSRVERVTSLKRNEVVAMKIVNKSVVSNSANYLRLLDRMHDMYDDLKTDDIIRGYEWFESLDKYYIAFELAAGGDMFDRILNYGRYTEAQAKGVMKRILGAMQWVHNYGLIHRDIKPENFFYRNIEDPLDFGMADFGLALVLDEKGDHDRQRFYEIAGTPGYAAPEIYKKIGYGKKSDIFGIGVLGYIALSSWSPWNSSEPKQLMQETMTLPVKFYASHWEGVSEEAKDFISMLVEKDPEKRPYAKEALRHPWLRSVSGEDKKEPAPVPQNLVRTKTAKAQTLYEGCELAKALTHHAQESDLAPEIAAQA